MTGWKYFYPRPPRGGRQQKRRKTSPLLFHYKTICTDLEELVQKHPKKELRSAQNGLKTWCEGDGKRVSAFHSHRGNRLEDQHVSGFKQGMNPDVLDLGLIVVAQLIKPQTVQIGVDEGGKLGLQNSKLRGVQQALEDRILHPLPVVYALFSRICRK